jgi:hypothetical protein
MISKPNASLAWDIHIEAAKWSPIKLEVGVMMLEASPILPTAVIPAVPSSYFTTPKALVIIITKIHTNRTVR